MQVPMADFSNSRRDFIKKSSLALAGGLLLPHVLWSLPADEVDTLSILHTNDTHSRLDPYPLQANSPYSGMGGIVRRKALIDQIRKEQSHTLLVDAGDIFQGTPYFNFFKGELEMKAMTTLGYEVATLGNHDFDEGVENLQKQMRWANFPFVSANYDFSDTVLADQVLPNTIVKKGDLRIGIFGLGINPQGLIPERLFGKTRFLDPLVVAKQQVAALQEQQVDFILCLSHLGYQYKSEQISDVVLAENVAGIDLIVGGHTHSFLDQPDLRKNPEGKPTLVAQVGHSGLRLGRLDFRFEKASRKRRSFLNRSTNIR